MTRAYHVALDPGRAWLIRRRDGSTRWSFAFEANNCERSYSAALEYCARLNVVPGPSEERRPMPIITLLALLLAATTLAGCGFPFGGLLW